MTKRGAGGTAALAALAVASVAFGYILPGPSILKRLAEGRDELQLATLKVDGTLSFFGSAAREAGAALGLPADRDELQVDAAASLKVPGRCRLEASSLDTGKSSAAIDSHAKRRAEGNELASLAVALEQLCPLLASRSATGGESRQAIERHLAALKVDINKVSLARQGGQVVYVLGEPAEGSPQLWVYKDNFMPARLRFAADGLAWDLRLLDYSSPATGEWFPRVVELDRKGEPWLRFTGLTADAKAKLDDKLF